MTTSRRARARKRERKLAEPALRRRIAALEQEVAFLKGRLGNLLDVKEISDSGQRVPGHEQRRLAAARRDLREACLDCTAVAGEMCWDDPHPSYKPVSAFTSLSPEELAILPRITEKEVQAALEKGRRDAEAARAAVMTGCHRR